MTIWHRGFAPANLRHGRRYGRNSPETKGGAGRDFALQHGMR